MPLTLKIPLTPEGVVGVWKNEEEDIFFAERLSLFPEEEEEVSILKNRKKTEWLSSRHLLHLLSERSQRGACLKDKYGKPYLQNSSYHISMSHTADYTAVIGSPISVGVDIQVIVPKIERIAPKFVSPKESFANVQTNHLETLHAIWGAKESMYKAYGRRELDFKGHMEVHPFTYDPDGFTFSGLVKKDNFFEKYSLFCHPFEQLILVYAIQQ
jgi:4'-phosphopantetheinyl transferase